MNIDSAGGRDEFVVTLRYNSDLINGAFSEFYLFAKAHASVVRVAANPPEWLGS
jgi:hypothetical protein